MSEAERAVGRHHAAGHGGPGDGVGRRRGVHVDRHGDRVIGVRAARCGASPALSVDVQAGAVERDRVRARIEDVLAFLERYLLHQLLRVGALGALGVRRVGRIGDRCEERDHRHHDHQLDQGEAARRTDLPGTHEAPFLSLECYGAMVRPAKGGDRRL